MDKDCPSERDLGALVRSLAILSPSMPEEQADSLRAEAWIGDAVLELYARERILREAGAVDGAAAIRMTSNQFLTSFGEPTEVEARIGRVYRREGLAGAFAWIDREILPVVLRQEAKRLRGRGSGGR